MRVADLLSLDVTLDRDALAPGEDATCHLVARLKGLASAEGGERPRLSVAFAIDISASMEGPPLEHVKRSLAMIIDLLGDDDRLSVTVFSEDAAVIAPLEPLRENVRSVLKRRLARLEIQGATNIEAGLRTARGTLPARAQHEKQVVLLLSDGQPNHGEVAPAALSDIAAGFRPDVAVTSLGYGAHHDEDVLFALSQGGGGQYVFISDPLECQTELARSVGAQSEVIADALELAIRPDDERVEVLEVFQLGKTRFSPRGLLLPLPDLLEDGRRTLAARLKLTPPTEPGPWRPVTVSLRFRSPLLEGEHEVSVPLEVAVKSGGGAVVGDALREVLLARTDLLRAEARAHADRGAWDSAAALVRGFMAEVEAAPGFAQGDGSDLAEAYEQLLDEAVAYEMRPSAESYRHFKRSQLGTEAASGGVHLADREATSAVAKAMLQGAAGDIPPARLVATGDRLKGQSFPLGREVTLGRVRGNDIVIPAGNVSRRHTRVVARDGKFVLVDLGTTNGTFLNGERLRSPKVLAPGDLVTTGDASFRFELDGDGPGDDKEDDDAS